MYGSVGGVRAEGECQGMYEGVRGVKGYKGCSSNVI